MTIKKFGQGETSPRPRQASEFVAYEIVYIPLGVFFCPAIFFLQLPGQLIPVSVDLIDVIISQISPFFLNGTFELLPFSLNDIPIHFALILSAYCDENQARLVLSESQLPNENVRWAGKFRKTGILGNRATTALNFNACRVQSDRSVICVPR